jgi:hypothetical protein
VPPAGRERATCNLPRICRTSGELLAQVPLESCHFSLSKAQVIDGFVGASALHGEAVVSHMRANATALANRRVLGYARKPAEGAAVGASTGLRAGWVRAISATAPAKQASPIGPVGGG